MSKTKAQDTSNASEEKQDGFLRTAWQKLTHRDDVNATTNTSAGGEDGGQDEEPKKATGSS